MGSQPTLPLTATPGSWLDVGVGVWKSLSLQSLPAQVLWREGPPEPPWRSPLLTLPSSKHFLFLIKALPVKEGGTGVRQ